jgi:hypothetical protein
MERSIKRRDRGTNRSNMATAPAYLERMPTEILLRIGKHVSVRSWGGYLEGKAYARLARLALVSKQLNQIANELMYNDADYIVEADIDTCARLLSAAAAEGSVIPKLLRRLKLSVGMFQDLVETRKLPGAQGFDNSFLKKLKRTIQAAPTSPVFKPSNLAEDLVCLVQCQHAASITSVLLYFTPRVRELDIGGDFYNSDWNEPTGWLACVGNLAYLECLTCELIRFTYIAEMMRAPKIKRILLIDPRMDAQPEELDTMRRSLAGVSSTLETLHVKNLDRSYYCDSILDMFAVFIEHCPALRELILTIDRSGVFPEESMWDRPVDYRKLIDLAVARAPRLEVLRVATNIKTTCGPVLDLVRRATNLVELELPLAVVTPDTWVDSGIFSALGGQVRRLWIGGFCCESLREWIEPGGRIGTFLESRKRDLLLAPSLVDVILFGGGDLRFDFKAIELDDGPSLVNDKRVHRLLTPVGQAARAQSISIYYWLETCGF